jgi:serine/threonine-protein kinase RsbW
MQEAEGLVRNSMIGNRVSYTLDSTLDSVNQAEDTARSVASETGFDEETVERIAMSVREAAVNAVLHGNAYAADKKVRLDFERTAGGLAITVRDEGPGMEESKIPDPLAPENLLKTSGRGIFLMRAFMDEVRIRSLQPGTEITLIKHVGGGSSGAKEGSK